MIATTIIGGQGFVGSRLAAILGKTQPISVPNHRDPAEFERAVFSAPLGVVYYCAGLTADYAQRPYDTVEAHVSLLARVLRTANFTRLIYLSSTRLYDSLGDAVCTESSNLTLSPHDPRHIYDFSKALGESLCVTASGQRASVARLSCVYEATEDAPGFLSGLLLRLKSEHTITLPSSPGYVRDYIHVSDVVNALVAIAAAPMTGIYNVGSGENVSNADLGSMVARHDRRLVFTGDVATSAAPTVSIAALERLGIHPKKLGRFVEQYLQEEQ